MKTTLVKIDIATIKENKDYGSTQTTISTGKTTTFKANVLPNYFKNGENCVITSWQETDGVKIDIEGYIISDDLIKKCFKDRTEGVEIIIENHLRTINHQPIPKYSFKYKNTEVICSSCGERVMTDDLMSEESLNGECYSDKICPKCGEFDCCSLKYESIDDVLK